MDFLNTHHLLKISYRIAVVKLFMGELFSSINFSSCALCWRIVYSAEREGVGGSLIKKSSCAFPLATFSGLAVHFTVHCTVQCTVHCTEQCTLYSAVQCTLYSAVQCTAGARGARCPSRPPSSWSCRQWHLLQTSHILRPLQGDVMWWNDKSGVEKCTLIAR